MNKRFTPLVAVLLLVLLAAMPSLAVTYNEVFADKELRVGPSSAPALTVNGSTKAVTMPGNLTVTGTVTATGGVTGGVETGTFADGTVGAPGFRYTNDTNTGMRRVGADNPAIVVGGADIVSVTTSGAAITGTLSSTGAATISGTANLNGGIAVDTTGFTLHGSNYGISWVPTATTGTAGSFDFSTLTSGDGLKLTVLDATLNGGKAINLYGGTGTTSVFSVGENGTTTISPNLAAGNAVHLIGGSTDGTTITTGVLLKMTADDDNLTSGKYIQLLGGTNHATEVFSIGEAGATTITPSTVDATGLHLDGTLTTTGNLLTLTAIDGTLDGGLYINCLGNLGATAEFTVGEGGNTVIAGTLSTAGLASLNAGLAMDTSVFTIADTTGVISWVPTTTNLVAATFDGSTITSGTILEMNAVDATLNGGKYLDLQGGAGSTTVFSIGEDGATAITSTAVATNSFSITNNATTSGDLVILTADDDTLDADTYYINMLGDTNHATSVFSIGEGGQTVITPTAASAAADAIQIAGAALTTGDGLQIAAVDATLNGGKYLNLLGGAGATAVFTVAEDGVTAITSTVATSQSLSITNLTASTGDAIVLTLDDDILTAGSGFYLNCLGGTAANTSVFSITEGGVTTITPTAAAAAVDALTITGTLTTTGDAISVSFVDGTLNGGKYLNFLGGAGAAEVFSVGEDGVTAITNTVATSNSFSIANTVATTGVLVTLTADDDTLAGGYYAKLLGGTNAATTVLTIGEGGVIAMTPTAAAAAVDSLAIDATVNTSGDLISLTAVDATLNGGKYLLALGGAGATEVFSIGEDGVTAITSTAVASNSLTITNNTATTGDLLTLTADDDTLVAGGLYVNCLGGTDHATAVFSIAEGGATTITPTAAAVTSNILYLDGTLTTTGDFIEMKAIDGTLNGGLYINCLGGGAGATTEFTVGEGGVVVAAGDVSAPTLTLGGGYGDSGISTTAAGALSMDSNLIVGGTATITGTLQAKAVLTATSTSNALVLDSTYYGKETFWSPTDTATITFPANGAAAGTWFKVICLTDQTTSYNAATADTLITRGNTTADGVTFSTASNKIGNAVYVVSNGSVWLLTNASDCTMTVVDGA